MIVIHRRSRFVAALGASLALTTCGLIATASASPGVGTYTQITTPAASVNLTFDTNLGTSFPVSGVTSLDVTSVDFDCINESSAGVVADLEWASAVPVSNGTFSSTATVPASVQEGTCRLRAVPSGESLTGYLGNYSGPLIFPASYHVGSSGSTDLSVTAIDSGQTAIDLVDDVGVCGGGVERIDPMSLQPGAYVLRCAWAIPALNDADPVSATGSSITVDGHNAYVPDVVAQYLDGTRALAVNVDPIQASVVRRANGDLAILEIAPLDRCSVADTFPPTNTSCPSTTGTGVSLERTLLITGQGHQLVYDDHFISTDHAAHTVAPSYQIAFQAPAGGAVGFAFPHHSSTPARFAPGTVVSGFGTGASTAIVRSDIYAAADEPTADSLALTWSRPPTAVTFSATTANQFGVTYSLSVPAGGSTSLGLTASESETVAAVKTLGAAAAKAMIATPKITTPKPRATEKAHTFTVSGTLAAGTNGFPVSATVNGHKATIKPKSASFETYSVKLTLKKGKRTVTVVAKDAGGNSASTKETVTVK
jgi:hypothetical protein